MPASVPSSSPAGSRRRDHLYFGQRSLQSRVLLSQLPLTLSVLVVGVVCLVAEPSVVLAGPLFMMGVAGVLALTALAAAVPWDRLPPIAYWSIPLLDFVAIAPIWGSARHVMDGMTMLAAFPVFWLAWSGIRPAWGITLAVLGSAAVAWSPYLADLPAQPLDVLVRPVVIPLFMLALAVAASVLTRSMDRQHAELQQALAQTRRQNLLMETVLETTSVGIVVTDRNGNAFLRNSTQRRWHAAGLPCGGDDTAEPDMLIFEADGITPIPATERPVCRAARGESFQGRLLTVGTGPNRQTLTASAEPLHNEEGAFDGAVVVFHNVTDLVDAIQSQERFLANVSHELRTPLTSIIGYLDMALDSDLDPVLARYLTTTQRNAERLLDLVSTLLDAAAGEAPLSKEPTDLVRLLRHSVESAAVRARTAGINLESDLPDHIHVVADSVKMSQVADNLVANALKYTPPGGTVQVSARQEGDWAMFEVRDTGIGLTPEELSKVFTSFYRTEYVRRAAIPGTGLGLAISQSIVHAHGGEITASSEVGVGSVFTVRISADGAAAAPAAALAAETTPGAAPR